MQSPATVALDRAGVSYDVTEYAVPDAEEGYGSAVVEALGLHPDTVAKTLITELDGAPAVAVVPVSTSLDLKALARVAGAKRAAMAAPAVAERLTGSVVGGIAPLGHRKAMPVFVDELLTVADVIHVSGGRRGLELSLTPHDLVATTAATVATITV